MSDTIESDENPVTHGKPGFFGSLAKSVFEPGVNPAVVMAMNLCFFLLVLTLIGLAILTQGNRHVLLLIGMTTFLWGSMVWFVAELTRLQSRPDNLPPPSDFLGDEDATLMDENRKEK
ncbi:hypothetical protein L204_106231 [Cryptococcus depauperatus]